jgi:hypothetical protein
MAATEETTDMDDTTLQAIITAAATIAAMVLSIVAAWLQTKKKEAYDQGDIILSAAANAVGTYGPMVATIPQLADPVARLNDAIFQLKTGWEDAKFTNEQMQAVKADIVGIMADIKAIISAYQMRNAPILAQAK